MAHLDKIIDNFEEKFDELFLAYNILGTVLFARGYAEASPEESFVIPDWIARTEDYLEYDLLTAAGQQNILRAFRTLSVFIERVYTCYEGWEENSMMRDTSGDSSFCLTQWSK